MTDTVNIVESVCQEGTVEKMNCRVKTFSWGGNLMDGLAVGDFKDVSMAPSRVINFP